MFPELAWLIGGVGVMLMPLAIGIAILKYRLYDIDLIINRTLVYSALTACVVGVYVLVVGYLGQLFRTEDNLFISLIAAGLVAVLFAPLRDRLQRAVNRLMYGERDDPYRVLSRLGERLKATDAPEAVLPTIVETVTQALKLPYAAIALKRDDGEFETVAARGHPKGEPLVLPLSYGAETIGQLILSPRAPGEPFGPADKRLLDDLARHAEAAAYAVRLTADLQRSRERLVNAREEERRRLRRDLHDGLGPQLATLTLKLDAARNLLSQEPQAADALLAGLKTQTQAAISDIRRLVYDLRPPALDELGLIPAIREQAANYAQNGLNVSVEAPEELPPLPAAVEVAAYRIVQEALTNVSHHSRARECRVRLSISDGLELEITDDGIGLPEDRRAGVGLSSMRERAAELGGACAAEPLTTGGTRVLARLPLPASGEKL
ncbi:MAG: sensor histidine kinase [Actinomycetota bacterium]|nr:sensor histidine kinase [Actinomycetota bacterium]